MLRELAYIKKDRIQNLTKQKIITLEDVAKNTETVKTLEDNQLKDEQQTRTSETTLSQQIPSTIIHSPLQTTKKEDLSPKQRKTNALLERIIHKALMYKDKGQFDAYEKKLIEWLAIDDTHAELNKKLADRYFLNNNHKKSLSLLKKTIEHNPDDHEALWQLGEIYLEQWEFKEADLLVQRAIWLAADRPKYYISLVEVKYNANQIEEAIALMKKAIWLRPNNVSYLLAIAWLYEEHWDIDNSKKFYFDILELEPTNTKARRKLHTL